MAKKVYLTKLVFRSVSTPLDNLLQPVRHTLHHVAQNLAVDHLEDPQPGDLLLQCLQVGGVGVLLPLHLHPAPHIPYGVEIRAVSRQLDQLNVGLPLEPVADQLGPVAGGSILQEVGGVVVSPSAKI